MMKRAMFVATVGGFFNFERNDIAILQSMGYEVHCAANFSLSEWDDFRAGGIIRHQIDFTRLPWSKTNLAAYREMSELLSEIRFDLVHCHTPMGGVVARTAARRYRKAGMKVIYTAHGFHFFKGAPLKNWLLYFPVEWVLAHWTDVLITINREDYARAKRCMKAKKVVYVPGVGIDTGKFSPDILDEAERGKLRAALGVEPDDKMLLSVGELSERKNHGTVLQALGQLRDERIRYFICGQGELEEELKEQIRELNLAESVYLLGYRTDISELCCCADLFVFPSLQEGLPVALMEAVASRTPVICSNIRGNTDIIADGNAMFDPSDSSEIARKIEEYINTDRSLEAEQNYMRLRGYDITSVMQDMQGIYRGGVRHLDRLAGAQRLRRSIGVPLDAVLLLSVGELNENKNHGAVIRAMAGIRNQDIHYAIAGIGELRDHLCDLAREMNVSDRVHLLGYCSGIKEIYSAADVFVHPSFREGLSVALMEAMASGLPVICSDIRGNRDLVINEMGGIWCGADDVEGYRRAMVDLSYDKKRSKDMGRYNAGRIKGFDKERVRREMEHLYRSDEDRRPDRSQRPSHAEQTI